MATIPDLAERPIKSVKDLEMMLAMAMKGRDQACAAKREPASHATVMVTFRTTVSSTLLRMESTGKLVLVELAGVHAAPEDPRKGGAAAGVSGANPQAVQALEDVLAATYQGSGAVPFRGSPLTKLMMDCVGDDGTCVLLAHTPPLFPSMGEAVNSLKVVNVIKNVRSIHSFLLTAPLWVLHCPAGPGAGTSVATVFIVRLTPPLDRFAQRTSHLDNAAGGGGVRRLKVSEKRTPFSSDTRIAELPCASPLLLLPLPELAGVLYGQPDRLPECALRPFLQNPIGLIQDIHQANVTGLKTVAGGVVGVGKGVGNGIMGGLDKLNPLHLGKK